MLGFMPAGLGQSLAIVICKIPQYFNFPATQPSLINRQYLALIAGLGLTAK